MSLISPVPSAVLKYFGSEVKSGALHPVVVSEFRGAVGWVKQNYAKRISRSWARKLRRNGVTHVALKSGIRQADFSIDEILNGNTIHA